MRSSLMNSLSENDIALPSKTKMSNSYQIHNRRMINGIFAIAAGYESTCFDRPMLDPRMMWLSRLPKSTAPFTKRFKRSVPALKCGLKNLVNGE